MNAAQIKIKTTRLDLGLSQRSAALSMGINRETLRKIESSGAMPEPAVAKRVADFCGTTVTELWPLQPDTTEAAA